MIFDYHHFFFADAIYVTIQPPREASLTEVVRRASG